TGDSGLRRIDAPFAEALAQHFLRHHGLVVDDVDDLSLSPWLHKYSMRRTIIQRRRANATGESSQSEADCHKQKVILTAAMGRCITCAWREYVSADRSSLRGPLGPSPRPDRPTGGVRPMRPLVPKLGGELIESPEQRQRIAGLA